jgi:hypothetical protein
VEFLTKWIQQAKLYQKLLGNSSTFSDREKMVHLGRSLSTIPELRQIKTTADVLAASTGNTLCFDKYYDLLSSAAAQYEASLYASKSIWCTPVKLCTTSRMKALVHTMEIGSTTKMIPLTLIHQSLVLKQR